MKEVFNNLIIISGTGRNTGKTTLACMLLHRFSTLKPIALKISPHWHEIEDRKNILTENERFVILSEQNMSGDKDSSRMLLSGASRSYHIQSKEDGLLEAFNFLKDHFGSGPVVCESASLADYVTPAYHLCMTMPGTDESAKKQHGYDRLIINTCSMLENFIKQVSFINNKWELI